MQRSTVIIIVALCAIIFAYWCSQKGFENKLYFNIPSWQKHTINFTLIVLVAVAGYYALLKTTYGWVVSLWFYLYALVVTGLAILGAIDVVYRFPNESFRELVKMIREFFTSPVPFAVMLLIARSSRSVNSNDI